MRAAGRLIVALAPAVVWAGLIFALSAQQDLRFLPDDDLDFVIRKAGHMGVFGTLALLIWRGLASSTELDRPWVWAFALTTLYAISDELRQGVVGGRHPAVFDVAIDAAGALVAIGAIHLVRSRGARRA